MRRIPLFQNYSNKCLNFNFLSKGIHQTDKRGENIGIRTFAQKLTPEEANREKMNEFPTADGNRSPFKLSKSVANLIMPVLDQTHWRNYVVNESGYDLGLRKFTAQVYYRFGLALSGTFGISLALVSTHIASAQPLLLLGLGYVIASFSTYGIFHMTPKVDTYQLGEEPIHYATDNRIREVSFGGLITGMGILFSLPMEYMVSLDPSIFPLSLIMSFVIFGGCAYYSAVGPDLYLANWRNKLAIGFVGVVSLEFTNFLYAYYYGVGTFFDVVMGLDVIGGFAIFAAMSVFDAFSTRLMYKDKYPDHILCASLLYFDFINIFLRAMIITSKSTTFI